MTKNQIRRGPYNREYTIALTMSGNDRNKKKFRSGMIDCIAFACAEIKAGRMKEGDMFGLKRIKCIRRFGKTV